MLEPASPDQTFSLIAMLSLTPLTVAQVRTVVLLKQLKTFEQVPYMQVANISQTIVRLKKFGYLVIGLDENSTNKISSFEKGNNDIAIVFGAEGKGIRRLTKEHCDMLVSIDGNHNFSSLNVSTAVGITLFNIQAN